MNWAQLGTVIVGVACVVLGVVLPATGQYLIPAGAALVGLAVPAFAKKGNTEGK